MKSFEQRIMGFIFEGKFRPITKDMINVSYMEDQYSIDYTLYRIAILDRYGNETGEVVDINVYYTEFGTIDMVEMFNYNGGYQINNNSEFNERLMENLEHALNIESFEEFSSIEVQKCNEGSRILVNGVEQNDIHHDAYLEHVVYDAMLSDNYYDHNLTEWVL